MNNRTIRVLSALLVSAMMLVVCAMPASAMYSSFAHSESYVGSKYYQQLTEVELTGDPRTDIVNIAVSQLGYREGGMRGEYAGEGYRLCNNFTEYGYNLGEPDSIWCTTFIWWCARQAGLDEKVFPDTVWPRLLAVNCPYVGYTPSVSLQPGDLLFVENTGDGTTDHLALVTEVTDTQIIAIEGNCGNEVAMISYDRSIGGRADGLGNIMYVGYLNYAKDPSIPDASALTQYVLLTNDSELYNKHTSGVNQGKASAGMILQLLAVRSDRQWYQVELDGYAYWIKAYNAVIGSEAELNARLAEMRRTTTTTTTTTTMVTTTTEVTSDYQTTSTYLDGINPLTTESTKSPYTVYVLENDEAAAYEEEDESFIERIGGVEKLILALMFVLVVIVFTMLMLIIRKRDR